MTILQAIILGIIQGITEFLPISSSGHLVIIPYLLGWDLPTDQVFPFDVLIQIGTLIAVIVFYWGDLIKIAKSMLFGIKNKKPFAELPARIGWLTILATIPAGLVGLLLKDQIESVFSRPDITSFLLIVTAAILFYSEKIGKKSRDITSINWLDAVVMGTSQALSIFPGISRSGSTISGGLVRNLDRKTSGQFTFLMAIPIMAAAGLLSFIDLLKTPNLSQFMPIMLIGFITSGIVGFFSIRWLLKYISNHSLIPFAIYCLILGMGSFLLSGGIIPSSIINKIDPLAESYRITYSSSVGWIIPTLDQCSSKAAGTVFLLDQLEKPSTLNKNNVHISYDDRISYPQFTYQLGTDSLIIGVNQNSPMVELSESDLRDIYEGKTTTFSDLKANCNECLADGISNEMLKKAFRIWAYPKDSFLGKTTQNTFQFAKLSPEIFFAPNPSLMKQAVLLENSAIGIFPDKAVTNQIRVIPLTDLSNEQSHLSIIASSFTEPDALLTKFLECIQNSI